MEVAERHHEEIRTMRKKRDEIEKVVIEK